jgi:homeobox protein engrailed
LSSKSSSSSSESESVGGKDSGKDEDLPPGMVRGPNGQLWPAWVFCTRYSDRPSSGENLKCHLLLY